MVLGPVVGHALFEPPAGEPLWPPGLLGSEGHPEAVKHGRYVVALLGPVLLTAMVVLSTRRRIALSPRAIRGLVALGQLALLLFVTVALLGQNNRLLPALAQPLWPIFSVTTMVAAGAAAIAIVAGARSKTVLRLVGRMRETRALSLVCLLVAIALSATWLLTAVVTERTLGDGRTMWWTMNDSFAILNGRAPLVNYHALYVQLSSYVSAATLATFGETVLTFALTMVTLSLVALLSVYALLRRLVGGRSLLALALYAPFLATGFLAIPNFPDPAHSLSNAILFAIWPMRYGGAYVVAWLTARHIDGASPRRAWWLFFAATLVALDNLEFGATAFAATAAAVLCARPQWSREALARYGAQLAAGALGGVAAISAATLLRSGELPHLDLLLEWPRVFGVLGLVALQMPTLGFHLVLFATYVAAIVVAVVRRLNAEPQRALTGMLAWSGVFGLGSAGYYLGRSDILKLVALFSAWALALTLLTIVVVQRLAAHERRRLNLADLLVLFGFGLALCSLRGLPAPGRELSRLWERWPPATYVPAATRFVAAHTRPRERVTILIPLGHRIAHQLDLTNVSPYAFVELIVTRRAMRTMLDVTRREDAHKLFVPDTLVAPPYLEALRAAGFSRRANTEAFSEWTDD
jgi:hypothetical protein